MRIFVKLKANSIENKVVTPAKRLLETVEMHEYYNVYVKEPPIEGRANDAVIEVLAEHFNKPRSMVRLVSGAVSKIKVFEIK